MTPEQIEIEREKCEAWVATQYAVNYLSAWLACASQRTTWQPIETAPKDNKRPLYLSQFKDGVMTHLAFNGNFVNDSDHPHWDGYLVAGIPTHWAYQDEPIPQVPSGGKLVHVETLAKVRDALMMAYRRCPDALCAQIRQAVNDLECVVDMPRSFDAAPQPPKDEI